MLANNPFLRLQQEFSSAYKIDKFVKSHSKYISPVTIKLPPSPEGLVHNFQYVPVTELVKGICSEPGFQPAVQTPVESCVLHDVKDGAAWRNNPYFQSNPDALSIILHSDEVELCNPLGPSKGKHKILNVYMTLAEIPKHQRLVFMFTSFFNVWRKSHFHGIYA